MEKSGKTNSDVDVLIFRLLRGLAFPILLFGILLLARIDLRLWEPHAFQKGRILHVILVISCLVIVPRRKFTKVNYALCFLPVFLLGLILFFIK